MRTNRHTYVAVIGLAVSFLLPASGCKTRQAQARQSTESKQPSPTVHSDLSDTDTRQVIMLILDRSQSVQQNRQDQLAEIREDASHLVRQLPPATRVFVRFISHDSYPDTERALSSVIPDEPPPPVHCSPFDLHCRRAELERKAQLRCVGEARERLATAFQGLNPPLAGRTDVWGAIAAAADVLSAYPQSQKFIVIYSDLIDNVGLRLPSQLPGLANAKVIVRVVKNDDPVPLAQRVLALSERLAKWGATVQSISPEVPLDGNIFVQSPATGNTLTASR